MIYECKNYEAESSTYTADIEAAVFWLYLDAVNDIMRYYPDLDFYDAVGVLYEEVCGDVNRGPWFKKENEILEEGVRILKEEKSLSYNWGNSIVKLIYTFSRDDLERDREKLIDLR